MRISILCFAMVLFMSPAAYGAKSPVNSIAAVVNGEMITIFDLQAQMAPELARLGNNPEQTKALAQKTLDAMINSIILTQEAVRLHIEAGSADVEHELKQFLDRTHLTPSEFQRQLQIQGMTEKAFRERIKNNILRTRLLANMVGRQVVVKKDEIAEYYNSHPGVFQNRQVHMALLVYPQNVDAVKMAARVKSGAVSFDKTVKEISVGPKAKEGGDLGYVPWTEIDPRWRSLIAHLKPGEVSGLFEIGGLPAQARLLDITSGDEQSLEEASEQIEAILRQEKTQTRFEEYTKQLRNRAVIDIRL